MDAFQKALRDLGYEEGKNIFFEYRWAGRDDARLPELARDPVRLNVDVIVVSGTPAIIALKEATTTIPFMANGDPVAAGLVMVADTLSANSADDLIDQHRKPRQRANKQAQNQPSGERCDCEAMRGTRSVPLSCVSSGDNPGVVGLSLWFHFQCRPGSNSVEFVQQEPMLPTGDLIARIWCVSAKPDLSFIDHDPSACTRHRPLAIGKRFDLDCSHTVGRAHRARDT